MASGLPQGCNTAAGTPTSALDGFSAGAPYWRAGAYWRNASGHVTFPLGAGGWSAGAGRKYLPLRGVTFAAGPALPHPALLGRLANVFSVSHRRLRALRLLDLAQPRRVLQTGRHEGQPVALRVRETNVPVK